MNSFQAEDNKSQKIYFENLDALRFLSFLSVFFYHSFYTEIESIKNERIYYFFEKSVFGNGILGVNFFFILSGFLITYLLIKEKQTYSQINLGKFWLRRMVRIWPVFYLCVFIGFIGFPYLKGMMGLVSAETANPLFYITFLSNFDMIYNGFPDSSILGVLWSISIEEQFYLVWPVLLFFLPVKHYWIVFVSVISLSLIFRFFENNDELFLDYHTLSCMGDLAIGGLGAYLIVLSTRFFSMVKNLSKLNIALFYIFFIAIYFFRKEIFYNHLVLVVVERLLIGIVFLGIILEQTFSDNSFFKFGRIKWFSSLGLISYGMYCYHFIGIIVTYYLLLKLNLHTALWEVLFLQTLISLLITILISRLSYTYFEKPFLKLKGRLTVLK